MQESTLIAGLGALALKVRLDTVRLLAAAGDEGLPAGEISRRLGVAQSTLSDHLAILTRSSLISSERRSRSIIYRIEARALRGLAAEIDSVCAAGYGGAHQP